MTVVIHSLRVVQWRSQLEIFLGGKMCDFRWATVFLSGAPLLKAQND